MEQIEIVVTEDVKNAAIRETLNQHPAAMATLCYIPSTGYAEVRRTEAGDGIGCDSIQVIDLSMNDACGSYIDSLVAPDSRLEIPGYPYILAIWGTDDDAMVDHLVEEYRRLAAIGEGADWAGVVRDNIGNLYTLDDAAYDIWEMIVEDIEYDGRYVVVEPGE